jgi:hypothetical protein
MSFYKPNRTQVSNLSKGGPQGIGGGQESSVRIFQAIDIALKQYGSRSLGQSVESLNSALANLRVMHWSNKSSNSSTVMEFSPSHSNYLSLLELYVHLFIYSAYCRKSPA